MLAVVGITAVTTWLAMRVLHGRPPACERVVFEFDAYFASSIACARKKCPEFRLIDGLNGGASNCTDGCGNDNPEPTLSLDSDLNGCESQLYSQDHRDYLMLVRCLAASKQIALALDPVRGCSSNKCAGQNIWQNTNCLNRCQDEAKDFMQMNLRAMELCAGIPQALPTLCPMLKQLLKICFNAEDCAHLNEIFEQRCSEVLG